MLLQLPPLLLPLYLVLRNSEETAHLCLLVDSLGLLKLFERRFLKGRERFIDYLHLKRFKFLIYLFILIISSLKEKYVYEILWQVYDLRLIYEVSL